MVQRFTPLAACAAIMLALILVAPAYGQVEVEDLGVQLKPLEPWGVSSDITSPSNAQTAPATIGDGYVVMQFKVTDLDSQNDDPSDVRIQCFTIHNLGSATPAPTDADDGDILKVGILDQDGNLIAAGNPKKADGKPNIAFEAEFCANGDNQDANNLPFTIPDNQSEIFQVAVVVNSSDKLLDDSQNHTVHLRATLEYEEKVGSFPADSTFTATVTDSFEEQIWNGGINKWTEDMFVVEPLMPNETGTVSRFTICDYDANEYNLIIDEMWFRQGADGTALHSDINTLKVYRLDGNTRTQVANLSVDTESFDRQNSGDGVAANGLFIFVGDDSCATFEVDAELSQYAFKGKTVQLEVKLSTQEPRNSSNGGVDSEGIDPSADPMITTAKVTPIGKGLVGISDVDLIASNGTTSASAQQVSAQQTTNPSGQIPIFVQGMKLPGLGAMQATFRYDPDVIQVKGITGAPGYTANSNPADNRRGEFTFQVIASDVSEDDFDPSDERADGIVAYINVDVVGNAGDRSRLLLELHDLKLSDDGEEEAADDVGVQPGEVRLVPLGDVNGDMEVTINDSILLANELLRDCSGLEDFQQIVGDVSDGGAGQTTDVPETGFDGCSGTLDSNDVAQISALALNSTSGASLATTSPVAPLAVSGIQTSIRGGTLEFAVQGSGIDRMKVDMFNLGGQRMVSESTSGNHLQLRAQAANGRPLANGVYLYTVTIQGYNNQVHRSEVRKLVILR